MSRLLADVVVVLTRWTAPSTEQRSLREAYLTHLRRSPDGLWRDGPPAHLTASCFVLDPTGRSALLTLHRKGGFWVQFGGHLEPGDASLAAAALREATEESGVAGLRLVPFGAPAPVDLDRHALSAAFGRCREHLDVAYLAVAEPGAVPIISEESDDVAWWPVDALPVDVVHGLAPRLARAAELVHGGQSPATGSSEESPMPSPAAADTPSR